MMISKCNKLRVKLNKGLLLLGFHTLKSAGKSFQETSINLVVAIP